MRAVTVTYNRLTDHTVLQVLMAVPVLQRGDFALLRIKLFTQSVHLQPLMLQPLLVGLAVVRASSTLP